MPSKFKKNQLLPGHSLSGRVAIVPENSSRILHSTFLHLE